MKVRIALLLIAAAGALAVVAGPRTDAALACDLSYWNIPVGNGCQWYTPGEGHSVYQFGPGIGETNWASWSVYNHMMFFTSTAGGSWTNSVVVETSPNGFRWADASDKNGCYNHNSGTKWVNCHHHDS
jgi:hypothetical protein